jgi:hypothetical protein
LIHQVPVNGTYTEVSRIELPKSYADLPIEDPVLSRGERMELPSNDEDIVVMCERVVDLPIPPVASFKKVCCRCQATVWYSLKTAVHVHKAHPEKQLRVQCLACSADQIKTMDPQEYKRQMDEFDLQWQNQRIGDRHNN